MSNWYNKIIKKIFPCCFPVEEKKEPPIIEEIHQTFDAKQTSESSTDSVEVIQTNPPKVTLIERVVFHDEE